MAIWLICLWGYQPKNGKTLLLFNSTQVALRLDDPLSRPSCQGDLSFQCCAGLHMALAAVAASHWTR